MTVTICNRNSGESSDILIVDVNGESHSREGCSGFFCWNNPLGQGKTHDFDFSDRPNEVNLRLEGDDGLCIESVVAEGRTLGEKFWLDNPCDVSSYIFRSK